jgi:hypothetical protein
MKIPFIGFISFINEINLNGFKSYLRIKTNEITFVSLI